MATRQAKEEVIHRYGCHPCGAPPGQRHCEVRCSADRSDARSGPGVQVEAAASKACRVGSAASAPLRSRVTGPAAGCGTSTSTAPSAASGNGTTCAIVTVVLFACWPTGF